MYPVCGETLIQISLNCDFIISVITDEAIWVIALKVLHIHNSIITWKEYCKAIGKSSFNKNIRKKWGKVEEIRYRAMYRKVESCRRENVKRDEKRHIIFR